MTEKNILVFDVGTRILRAGFPGEEKPRVEISNVMAIPKRQSMSIPFGPKQTLFGEEAEEKKPVAYDIIHPVKNGVITNIDAFLQILDYAIHKLNVNTSECKFIFAMESQDKEKLLNELFTKFNPTEIFVANQALLCLICHGLSDGLIVNFGEGTSHAIPIIKTEMQQDFFNACTWGFNGQNLTERLRDMLGFPKTAHGLKCAREIQMNNSFVVADPKATEKKVDPILYKLDDEQEITIGPEQLKNPEVLFVECHIQDVIVKAIDNCEEKDREVLYKNIILAGGYTMIKGFPERLEYEIKNKALDRYKSEVHIEAPEERTYSAWKGGSKVALEGLFPENWISGNSCQK